MVSHRYITRHMVLVVSAFAAVCVPGYVLTFERGLQQGRKVPSGSRHTLSSIPRSQEGVVCLPTGMLCQETKVSSYYNEAFAKASIQIARQRALRLEISDEHQLVKDYVRDIVEHCENVEAVLGNAQVDVDRGGGKTRLMEEAAEGNLSSVELLLANGASPFATTHNGCTVDQFVCASCKEIDRDTFYAGGTSNETRKLESCILQVLHGAKVRMRALHLHPSSSPEREARDEEYEPAD